MNKLFFFGCLLCVAAGLLSAQWALIAGVAFALLFAHPFERQSRRWAKLLLQSSVVALGFGVNLRELVATGQACFTYTAIGITVALGAGYLLGKLLDVQPKAAFLVSAGTAICGGSAIAAIAPITQPCEEELAMSLGTVFTLNSVALLLFPIIGVALHMSQVEFGLWAALAIHDISSVVGAAAKYGAQALAIGAIVKTHPSALDCSGSAHRCASY